jgi:hypothetical protein
MAGMPGVALLGTAPTRHMNGFSTVPSSGEVPSDIALATRHAAGVALLGTAPTNYAQSFFHGSQQCRSAKRRRSGQSRRRPDGSRTGERRTARTRTADSHAGSVPESGTPFPACE